jgi:hypothetical protein
MEMGVRGEEGSAVLLAVLAMLVLAVLSLSAALLADVESQTSVSHTQQAQAEALAEAGLDRARDAIRGAPAAGHFTSWFNGAEAAHVLFSGVELGGGSYSARIDNDCPSAIPGFPSAISEPSHQPGDRPCDGASDHNGVAVLTAWATSGGGRARVRAVVAIDSPWKHVCANARPDHTGYCNEPGNRNGDPTVSPADPNDPNGPAAYDDLPRPILGCSRIAPGIHRGPHALPTQLSGCLAHPGMYPHPYPVGVGASPRLVVMGEDAAAGGRTCYQDPVTPGLRYFGYFDCALQTHCDPATMPCGSWGDRKGCVVAGDSRLATSPSRYVAYDPVLGRCGSGGANETGLVCLPGQGCSHFDQDVGSPQRQLTMYVFRQNWSQASNRRFYGTIVAEGTTAGGTAFAAGGGPGGALWAGPSQSPPSPGWAFSGQYGYPLVALVYNPELAAPTVTPSYAPQGHLADFGGGNPRIHGLIYSGGHVRLDPLDLDGGVVAFEIQSQGGASLAYDAGYGDHTPPPGFPHEAGRRVVLFRKSVVACTNYSDDGPAPTACH